MMINICYYGNFFKSCKLRDRVKTLKQVWKVNCLKTCFINQSLILEIILNVNDYSIWVMSGKIMWNMFEL